MRIHFSLKVLCVLVLLCIALYQTGINLFPIQTVVARNWVLSELGLEERLVLPEKNLSRPRVRYPTLTQFQFDRYFGSRKLYTLAGQKLRFVDKKYWLVRTPLVREGEVHNPELVFHSREGNEVSCSGREGVLNPKTYDLSISSAVKCQVDGKQLLIAAVNLNANTGSLELKRFLQPRIVFH